MVLALLLLVVLAFGTAFALLAAEMREGETSDFDNTLLSWFRNSQSPTGLIGPPWVAETARDITSLGSFAILSIIIVLVLLYLLLVQRRFGAVHVGLAVISGTILSNILKVGFNRPRPVFENAPEVFTASFPSGHATMSAVVFLTLGAMLALHEPQRSLKVLYLATSLVLTLAVGLTRIYLGVHYPTDVVAGWCLGTGWAILWMLAAYAVNRRFAPQDGETLDRKTL